MGDYTIKRCDEVADVARRLPRRDEMMSGPLGTEQVAVTYRRMPSTAAARARTATTTARRRSSTSCSAAAFSSSSDDEVVEVVGPACVRVPPATARSIWNDEPEDGHLLIMSTRRPDELPDDAVARRELLARVAPAREEPCSPWSRSRSRPPRRRGRRAARSARATRCWTGSGAPRSRRRADGHARSARDRCAWTPVRDRADGRGRSTAASATAARTSATRRSSARRCSLAGGHAARAPARDRRGSRRTSTSTARSPPARSRTAGLSCSTTTPTGSRRSTTTCSQPATSAWRATSGRTSSS